MGLTMGLGGAAAAVAEGVRVMVAAEAAEEAGEMMGVVAAGTTEAEDTIEAAVGTGGTTATGTGGTTGVAQSAMISGLAGMVVMTGTDRVTTAVGTVGAAGMEVGETTGTGSEVEGVAVAKTGADGRNSGTLDRLTSHFFSAAKTRENGSSSTKSESSTRADGAQLPWLQRKLAVTGCDCLAGGGGGMWVRSEEATMATGAGAGMCRVRTGLGKICATS